MYEERKEKFSFKSFFLTLLLVLLFVFLMLWIFPTKWDIKDLQSTYDIERLSVLYDEIFANNVARMKDAAIGYFTNERMPQTVGESKKLTLQEMYDLHLVLKMKDKDGKACDVNKSYVEMTKYTEEYRLKVNLSCGNQEDYIIVYLGCYSYCSSGICEKQVSKPSNVTLKEEQQTNPKPTPEEKHYCKVVNGKYYDKNGNVVSKEEYDKSCTQPPSVVTKYMYEYKLVTDPYTVWSDWSKWQKDSVTETETVKVETKSEKEVDGYTTVKVQTGVKKEVITKKVTEKYISRYTTELVVVGTKQEQVGTTTKEVTEQVVIGTVEKNYGIDSGTKVPKNTETTTYKVISTDTPASCSYCENETIYTWEIWKVVPVYDTVTKTVTVPVYKTVNVYEEKTIPVYDYRVVEKKETVSTPIYEEIKIPKYKTVTYYRFKTSSVVPGTTDIKWSYNKMDAELIGKGYKLTGNVKKV